MVLRSDGHQLEESTSTNEENSCAKQSKRPMAASTPICGLLRMASVNAPFSDLGDGDLKSVEDIQTATNCS